VVKRTRNTPEVITVSVSTVCMFEKTGMQSAGPACIKHFLNQET